MSTRYAIAKYVDDLARNEPVNVGLIVFDSERAVSRFVGERAPGGRIDLRLLGKRVSAGQTFRSWVEYWRRSLAEASASEVVAPSPAQVVNQLVGSSEGNFILAPGGEVLVDTTGETLEELLDHLYQRLVGPRAEETLEEVVEPAPRRPRISERSLSALRRAGAPLDDPRRFRKNAGVSVTIAGVQDADEVSYAVMNGAWHYLQEVAFDPEDERATRREAHHAALLVDAAGLGSDAAFLYERDRVSASTQHLVEILEAVAPVIDIADEIGAADQLRTQLRLT